jgi:hypothetical protein
MAGFLDKKKRLIDYKLTEHGRSQLSTGDIRFKYYAFTDSSIVYNKELSVLDSLIPNIPESEFFYLPTEVSTDPGMYYNPEFYLSNEAIYDNYENDSIFNFTRTQKTFAENFSSSEYISDRVLANKNLDNNSLTLESSDLPDSFDFIDETYSRKYPTVHYLKENVENLPEVKKDYRFSNYLKFKRLDPIDSQGNILGSQSEDGFVTDSSPRNPIHFIYKTLDFKNEIFIGDEREDAIAKVVNLLSKNRDKLFYLDYNLDNSFSRANDNYVFEMHKIKDNNLSKLPFINLGRIFDKFNQKFVKVFLIGKFIKKEVVKESFNLENNTTIVDLSNDYYFVNLFTLVIE